MDVISNFAARFERTREEELSIEEYLAECKRNPVAYATAAERMLKAIGEPQDGRHAQRPAHVAHLRQQGHQDLPRLRRVLRHGGRHRAGGELLPPCRAGPGGEEADPLSARAGRRRQELDRRTAQAADGAGAVLRDQGLAGERVAARPVRPDRGRAAAREGIRHPAALPAAHPAARGPSSAWRSSAATSASSGSSSATRACSSRSASPRPSRATRTTRTSPRWSARSTSASSRPTRRTTPTPTASPAACAWPTRACSNSSRCSRRRSRCCTRC